jgi:hypothetical protein
MSKHKKMEAKKRKIEAFLTLAKMNDTDGRKRTSLEKKPRLEEQPETPEKKEVLSGDALTELRKKLRERKKKLQTIPDFQLKAVGHSASLAIPVDLRTPLLMRDLQHLLLYALLGTKAPVEPSR